MGRKEG